MCILLFVGFLCIPDGWGGFLPTVGSPLISHHPGSEGLLEARANADPAKAWDPERFDYAVLKSMLF